MNSDSGATSRKGRKFAILRTGLGYGGHAFANPLPMGGRRATMYPIELMTARHPAI